MLAGSIRMPSRSSKLSPPAEVHMNLVDAVLVFQNGKRLYVRVPPRKQFVLARHPGPDVVFVQNGKRHDGAREYVEGDRRCSPRFKVHQH
jgi:hypothetical protein